MAALRGAVQILVGMILLVVMAYVIGYGSWPWGMWWWRSLVMFVEGGILVMLFFVGIGLVLLGFSEMK